MTIIGLPTGDESPYRIPQEDWDAMAEADARYEANPKWAARRAAMPKSRTTLLPAEGGPFDGMELNVPPGGSEVVLPAGFGDGDMKGKVIYRRATRDDGTVYMAYAGQPEQILDEEDDEPGLL